jgi:serine/threonine protein kinase
MADTDIYPQLPFSWPVTVAAEPTSAQPHIFLKRISVGQYHYLLDKSYQPRDDAINMLRDEVQVLQLIAQHPPHSNIIKYHGCRVRRGFVTAVVLDRARGSQLHAYRHQGGTVEKARFLAAMRSAVHHLHSVVGVAHNDINPSNIMVVDGLPVLIDFGSCRPLGWKMGTSRGTPGWEPNSPLRDSSNDCSESMSFIIPFFTSCFFSSFLSSSPPLLQPCEQAICWPNILFPFFP